MFRTGKESRFLAVLQFDVSAHGRRSQTQREEKREKQRRRAGGRAVCVWGRGGEGGVALTVPRGILPPLPFCSYFHCLFPSFVPLPLTAGWQAARRRVGPEHAPDADQLRDRQLQVPTAQPKR